MAETLGRVVDRFLLLDPAWRPVTEGATPPARAVVGSWPVEDGGGIGKFRANPAYRPGDRNSPSDPLDAALRLLLRGRVSSTQIQLMMRDTVVDIALHGDGQPLVVSSPDGRQAVVVATGEPHRARIGAPGWRRGAALEDLAELLADEVDVLFNRGGPASVRLTGDFVREAMLIGTGEAAELYAAQRDSRGLRVIPWRSGDTLRAW
ncbi:type VII secretion system-associated protein [Amycolatopsis sp. CA-230715]|uniref:type VII secretion system-associated protein n=1 Tax=Amycolatopsis sp. CA-230715 TaxID=2745196 RepID=UPI001C013EB4|nr:type VII secretion system-associated protein [Amycolatopsis sp. CA-230715]